MTIVTCEIKDCNFNHKGKCIRTGITIQDLGYDGLICSNESVVFGVTQK